MLGKKDRLFCEINPLCYQISWKKEIAKRKLQDLASKEKFSKTIQKEKVDNVVTSYSSKIIKTGPGIDKKLQENKAVNIKLACDKIDGTVIHPGEVFSFWRTVGSTTKRKGYRAGRVIIGNKLKPGIGGGLCNLGNTIHYMVLHSPLDVIEFHNHSDALSPDDGKRKPFSTGTSISYNNLDYRFKNNTDQDIQLCVWCEEGTLHGELRSEREFPWSYKLIEEDHHFEKERDKYYRISKIYRQTTDKETGNVIEKKLVLDNHSEVMYDYSLIPKEQIKV